MEPASHQPTQPEQTPPWAPTACILCENNCGIEVQLGGDDGRQFTRLRGDRANPVSKGYVCQKAGRLNHYQNSRDRVLSPLRRRPDGSFEEIDWDTAIDEVAERFAGIRDRFGGESIFYYGGGGQGNHLPGFYARSTLRTLACETATGRLQLAIPELFGAIDALVATDGPTITSQAFPLVLSAGERRSFTANTIYRDPRWRRKALEEALALSPHDAATLEIGDGDRVRLVTSQGATEVLAAISDRMQDGHISLPNGLGLDYPDEAGRRTLDGVAPNELTAAADRDPIAGTPWHKSVPARLERISDGGHQEPAPPEGAKRRAAMGSRT